MADYDWNIGLYRDSKDDRITALEGQVTHLLERVDQLEELLSAHWHSDAYHTAKVAGELVSEVIAHSRGG